MFPFKRIQFMKGPVVFQCLLVVELIFLIDFGLKRGIFVLMTFLAYRDIKGTEDLSKRLCLFPCKFSSLFFMQVPEFTSSSVTHLALDSRHIGSLFQILEPAFFFV